jgi:hypothetical protein
MNKRTRTSLAIIIKARFKIHQRSIKPEIDLQKKHYVGGNPWKIR